MTYVRIFPLEYQWQVVAPLRCVRRACLEAGFFRVLCDLIISNAWSQSARRRHKGHYGLNRNRQEPWKELSIGWTQVMIIPCQGFSDEICTRYEMACIIDNDLLVFGRCSQKIEHGLLR